MKFMAIDAETFYSNEFTLKKLTQEAYTRDPRFQCLLWGVVYENGDKEWIGHEDIPAWVASIDWPNTAVLCHHAQFDLLILSHHYGVKPGMIFDTLSMARLVLGNHVSVSLAKLAEHFGLEAKNVPYDLFIGKRWEALDPSTRRLLGAGAIHDVELTVEIFKKLAVGFPQEEYDVIDMTVRMFTEPKLVGDVALLQKIQHDEFSRKNEMLIELGVRTSDLQSADKFVKLLEAQGVEVEYKNGKNGPIPAIAATDDFMRSLADDEDPLVATLAQARLEVRSTIDETRSGRLAGMARRGALPVYLGYCGAHTTRWSGGDKVNLQNLRRGGDIRKAIQAPRGCLLAVADLAQIECRVLNMFSGQLDVIERFRNKEDPYIGGASKFYGRPITKADKNERQLGKVLELQCGFGAGGDSIVRAAKRGTPSVILTPEEGMRARDVYREDHPHNVQLWKDAGNVLRWLADGDGQAPWRGVMTVEKGRLIGPTGVAMLYNLEWDADENGWKRQTRKGWVKIYGAKLVENLIQYLARLIMSEAMVRIKAASGLLPVTTSHDEAMYVIPDDQWAQPTLDFILDEFRRPPTWLPDIPLDAEGTLSERYEK